MIKSTHAESDKASDNHFVATPKCSENSVIAVHVQKSVEMQVPSNKDQLIPLNVVLH